MKKIHMKRFKIVTLLAIILTSALFMVESLKIEAASTTPDYGITLDGKTYFSKDNYTMQTSEIYPSVPTSVDNPGFVMEWTILTTGGDSIAMLADGTGEKSAGTSVTGSSCRLKAKGVGIVQLQLTVRDMSANVSTTILPIYVNFQIDRSDATRFKQVQSTDTKASLVMYANDTSSTMQLKPIFQATGVTYLSSNRDIVTCDLNTGDLTAVGSGATTVTASWSKDGITYSDTVTVYVLPRVSTSSGGSSWNPISGTLTMSGQTGASIYVDTKFGDSTDNLYAADKIQWVIRKDNGLGTGTYIPVANSWTQTDSSLPNLTVEPTSGKYTINATAGKYVIEFWTKGTYGTALTHPINPTRVDLTVLANMKDNSFTMIVGDSYNIPEAFNMDLATFNNLFDIKPDVGFANFITPNYTTGVISTINKGQISIDVIAKTGQEDNVKKLCPPDGLGATKSQFRITINILDSFSLNRSSAIMFKGADLELYTNSTYSGGTVVWTTSDDSYATVTQTGKVHAVKSTYDNSGNNKVVTITASLTLPDGMVKVATCRVSISDSVTKITLSETDLKLSVGQKKYIAANFTPSNSSTSNLVWVVSDPSIVQITPSDNKKSIDVTALKAGTTVIMVMNQDNQIYTSCKVTVTEPVSSITFTQTSKTVKLSDGFVELSPTVNPTTAADSLTWQSSDTTVASIYKNGVIKLNKAGSAIITVSGMGANGELVWAQCNLTVISGADGITLTKSTITVEAGKTDTITYTITPTTATTSINWSTMDSTIATVSSAGVVTGVAPGKTYITATTTEGKSATCTVIVTQSATGFTLDVYNLTLGVGDTYHVLATPSPAGSTEKTFTWTSKDPTIATVTDAGKVTGVAAGSTIILIKTQSGKVDYLYVTVKNNVSGMTLNYAQKSVAINRTFQLTPVFTPAKPTNTAVTWKSSDDKVASVSSKGLVKGLKGGTAIIFCTSQDGNYSASCIVTVNEIITSLSLNKSSYKLGLGKSITLKATIKTNTSTKQTLRWTSSNTSIATVSKKGKIIAKKVGKCTITAKATDGSGESATCTIYVVRQATSLSLNKAVVTVIEGKSVKLRAYIKPSNSTYRSVTWSSNDEGIAIVDASGRVTGFKAGVTKVKATTKDNSNKTAYCVINVIKEIAASSVIVSTKDMTLIKGQTGTVSVSVQPSNTTDKISYASDNRAIATVTNKGKITAKRAGNATVTITTSSGKQATVNVTVIGLNKTSMTMEQYSTDVLTVDGASSTTTTITWFSSNPSIATVDSTGKVVATKSGTTTIYATINGIRLSCNVRVNNIPSN